MFLKFLKYINSIPFNFTIRHYQIFGDEADKLKDGKLDSPESWDVLRKLNPQFSVLQSREEWIKASEGKFKKDGQDGGLVTRASDIISLLNNKKVYNIFSVGCGGAGLEYQIKKQKPEIKLFCSEYAEENVSLLKNVFLEADLITQFDILNGNWNLYKDFFGQEGVCIIYRVDASFDDETWRKIFEKLYSSKVTNVLFIPSPPLTIRSLINRKWREMKWFLNNNKVSFAGFVRSKKSMQSFWFGLYKEQEMKFGGLTGFWLTLSL